MSRRAGPGLWLVLIVALFLAGCYDRRPEEQAFEQPVSENRVTSVYLVTTTAGYPEQDIAQLFSRFEPTGIKRLDTTLYQITLSRDPGLDRLQALVAGSDKLRHIQPNYIYRSK